MLSSTASSLRAASTKLVFPKIEVEQETKQGRGRASFFLAARSLLLQSPNKSKSHPLSSRWHPPCSTKAAVGRCRCSRVELPGKASLCSNEALPNTCERAMLVDDQLGKRSPPEGPDKPSMLGEKQTASAEKLPIGFEQSLQAVPKFGPITYEGCEGAEILPIMPLAAVKFPTDKVALQLFEPRYRAMIKLVNQTAHKRFGIVLGDCLNATMESVGCVCVIEEYVPLPTRRRILIDARATGRFRVHKILLDKPFITAVVQEISDAAPASIVEEASLASLEMRVRQYMQDVEALAMKLYGHLGSVAGTTVRLDTEVRFCQMQVSNASVVMPIFGLQACLCINGRLALLAPILDRPPVLQASKGFPVAGGVHDANDSTRERFSFALLRTLDGLSLEDKQDLLECQSTSARLQRIEYDLLEGRRYLAARSTLRDTLS